MSTILADLTAQFPKITFSQGERFCWSPEAQTVFYKPIDSTKASWSLLHETGHALLDHKSYASDFQLLQMEVEAWNRAEQLAQEHDITIDPEHIQDCLDTYRDWLHSRSKCPTCNTQCFQDDANRYRCHNCHASWRVSANRFSRTYRTLKKTAA